jgi:hypothetical protein
LHRVVHILPTLHVTWAETLSTLDLTALHLQSSKDQEECTPRLEVDFLFGQLVFVVAPIFPVVLFSTPYFTCLLETGWVNLLLV